MNIYEYGPDFYAAKNLRDAVREIQSCHGDSRREVLREIRKMPDEELSEYIFHEDVYNQDEGETKTFQDKLTEMIAEGAAFPVAFASSEY